MNTNRHRLHKLTIIMMIIIQSIVLGQSYVENLGLTGKLITTMEMWESMIVVGTYGDGVFYQDAINLPDSGWINIGLEGKNISAVYPYEFVAGPSGGWGITVGIFPEHNDSNYIYCSFMGDDFSPNNAGISDSLADAVYSLAGFPTRAICGEKYAATGGALYRQLFGDTLWTPVYVRVGSEGEGVIHVKTNEAIGAGFVLAGGSEGITGILLIGSSDFGDSWEYMYPPGPAIAFDFDIDSSHTDFQTIFVSHGSQISRSLDSGNTWEIVYEDGWNWFSEVTYDPYTSSVFIAGGDGLDTSSAVLFFSNDLGDTWQQIPLNMSGPIVSIALTWDGYLYFATPYRGIFRISLDELSNIQDELPRTFVLHQNYPNPFNTSTTIDFELFKESNVELVIYDVLGGEVEKLVRGRMVSGKHKVVWNASNENSGIYFCQLKAGDYIETKKLLLIK